MTGAAGLIGAHIVRALVRAGHEVRCLVRPTSRRDSLDGLPVTWIVADLLHADRTSTPLVPDARWCSTPRRISPTALPPAVLHRTAVTGTEALLRACARQGVRTVVVTSSSVVFGHREDAASICETAALANGDG